MQHKPKNNIKKNASYFLTLTVVGWVDVFTRKNHRKAILEAFRYCTKNKGLNIYAYCVMSNHIHLIVNCNEPFQLKDTIRDLKRHIAKTIISQIINEPESRREWLLEYFEKQAGETNRNTKFKFWQTGNHAIEIYSEKFLWTKINYIHNNPVEEELVKEPFEYLYSSASNYYLGEGLLEEVFCIPPMLKKY